MASNEMIVRCERTHLQLTYKGDAGVFTRLGATKKIKLYNGVAWVDFVLDRLLSLTAHYLIGIPAIAQTTDGERWNVWLSDPGLTLATGGQLPSADCVGPTPQVPTKSALGLRNSPNHPSRNVRSASAEFAVNPADDRCLRDLIDVVDEAHSSSLSPSTAITSSHPLGSP